MNQIVFRKKDWIALHNHLRQRKDVESGAYAIFSTARCGLVTKFLVNQILIPKDSDYLTRSSAAVAFTPEFTEKAFQRCEAKRRHLLDIHTHPWSMAVQFSSIDDHEAVQTKVPYLSEYLPGTIIAFIVFGASPIAVRARFWDKSMNRLSNADRILVI